MEAARGNITDRNGKVLVSNRLTYTLIFSAKDFENDQDLNAAILRLTDLCTENDTVWNDTLPLSKTAPYSYTDAQDSEGFALFLKNKSIPYSKLSQVTPTLQPDRFMAKLRELFKIDSSYTDDQARTIAGVRYELAVKSLTDAQYVFADDVSVELISQTADGQYQGVSTGTSSARVYNTEYAAHVLGRLSPIYYEDWVGDPENGVTGYRDMEGYSMNSLVGREGAEKAFESYLHGTKGTRIITTNEEGKITGELYTKEPQPGGTVALTLDIDVQEDTEKSLAQTIQAMTAKDGIVRGGAAVVGIPVYLLTRSTLGNTGSMFLMIALMLPAFFMAMYERDGLPFEKVARNIIRAKFLRPGVRPYQTQNIYAPFAGKEVTLEQKPQEVKKPDAGR